MATRSGELDVAGPSQVPALPAHRAWNRSLRLRHADFSKIGSASCAIPCRIAARDYTAMAVDLATRGRVWGALRRGWGFGLKVVVGCQLVRSATAEPARRANGGRTVRISTVVHASLAIGPRVGKTNGLEIAKVRIRVLVRRARTAPRKCGAKIAMRSKRGCALRVRSAVDTNSRAAAAFQTQIACVKRVRTELRVLRTIISKAVEAALKGPARHAPPVHLEAIWLGVMGQMLVTAFRAHPVR